MKTKNIRIFIPYSVLKENEKKTHTQKKQMRLCRFRMEWWNAAGFHFCHSQEREE